MVAVQVAEGDSMLPARDRDRPYSVIENGNDMSVMVYLLLTVAIFALLGSVVKVIEGR